MNVQKSLTNVSKCVTSYVTRMQTAEIKHLAFCYFLGDVVMKIVGLGNS